MFCLCLTAFFESPAPGSAILSTKAAYNFQTSYTAIPPLLYTVVSASTMNPHISLPRHNSAASTFGGTAPSRRDSSIRMPRFFKRLFKFPQMDFEMAVWEMTSLIIAPKKVFRSIYYHVCLTPSDPQSTEVIHDYATKRLTMRTET